jgi:aspartate/methionine/tyrosine aminotransferase
MHCRYAPEQGYASFRACLADFLTSETGYTVNPDELLITAGVCVSV